MGNIRETIWCRIWFISSISHPNKRKKINDQWQFGVTETNMIVRTHPLSARLKVFPLCADRKKESPQSLETNVIFRVNPCGCSVTGVVGQSTVKVGTCVGAPPAVDHAAAAALKVRWPLVHQPVYSSGKHDKWMTCEEGWCGRHGKKNKTGRAGLAQRGRGTVSVTHQHTQHDR